MPADRPRGARWLREVDTVFAGLSHATRRQILLTLHFWGGTMTAGQIAGRFEHAWPTISRHLAELREAGLVECTLVGRERHYQLRREFIATVREWLGWFDVDPRAEPSTRARAGERLLAPNKRPPSKRRGVRATY